MRIGRNEPCPCGSGAKFKRCCGSSPAAVEVLRQREEALSDAAELPRLFPRLRAEGAAIADFARGTAPTLDAGQTVPRAVVAEGVTLLTAAERERILGTVAGEQPEEWARITTAAEIAAAETAVLEGAVTVAVESRIGPGREVLRAIEGAEVFANHPLQALAFAIPGARLWSITDVLEAGELMAERCLESFAEAADEIADEAWSDWHEERLLEQVAVVAAHLPVEGFPRASGLLATACAEVETDPGSRWEVGAAALMGYLVFVVGAADAAPGAAQQRAA